MTKNNEPKLKIKEAELKKRTMRRSGSWTNYDKKPRLYINVEGESVWEDFANRTSRPHTLYRKYLKEMFEALDLPKRTKANWSQKAGCSCPCSPGFILTLPDGYEDSTHFDAWVTLEAADEAKYTKNSLETRASRTMALVNDPTMPVSLEEPEVGNYGSLGLL